MSAARRDERERAAAATVVLGRQALAGAGRGERRVDGDGEDVTAAGPQDAVRLPQRATRVGDVLERLRSQHQVERSVGASSSAWMSSSGYSTWVSRGRPREKRVHPPDAVDLGDPKRTKAILAHEARRASSHAPVEIDQHRRRCGGRGGCTRIARRTGSRARRAPRPSAGRAAVRAPSSIRPGARRAADGAVPRPSWRRSPDGLRWSSNQSPGSSRSQATTGFLGPSLPRRASQRPRRQRAQPVDAVRGDRSACAVNAAVASARRLPGRVEPATRPLRDDEAVPQRVVERVRRRRASRRRGHAMVDDARRDDEDREPRGTCAHRPVDVLRVGEQGLVEVAHLLERSARDEHRSAAARSVVYGATAGGSGGRRSPCAVPGGPD